MLQHDVLLTQHRQTLASRLQPMCESVECATSNCGAMCAALYSARMPAACKHHGQISRCVSEWLHVKVAGKLTNHPYQHGEKLQVDDRVNAPTIGERRRCGGRRAAYNPRINPSSGM